METSVLSVDGRIRRSTYFFRLLMTYVVMFAVGVIAAVAGADPAAVGALINITSIFTSIFMFLQGVKRMHDVGKSGWYLLMPIYNLILILSEGTHGPNEYGDDPKQMAYRGWNAS
jgi:uncharacterized membrane protein YhaH (DUF805 family)